MRSAFSRKNKHLESSPYFCWEFDNKMWYNSSSFTINYLAKANYFSFKFIFHNLLLKVYLLHSSFSNEDKNQNHDDLFQNLILFNYYTEGIFGFQVKVYPIIP